MIKTYIKNKLFWYTIRMLKKRDNIFARGAACNIIVTTKCPYHCSYCPSFIYGEPRKYEESTFEQWVTFLNRFQIRLSAVYVSGGEPTLYKDIVPLINYLLEKKHHVILQTNLFKAESLIGITPKYNLLIHATFHESEEVKFSRTDFFDRADMLKKLGFNVQTQQIGSYTQKTDRNKEFFTEDWFKNEDDSIIFEPSTPTTLRMWTGCINMYKQ